MKRILGGILFLFFLCECGYCEKAQWQHESRSTHFIVYYNTTPESFIDRLKNKAEEYYDIIADDLGFRRYNFWLWDNRAKIFIYDSMQEFQAGARQPGWAAGAVQTKEKVLHTYPEERNFFESILPHELGHIIFREFVGFDNPAVTFWLDEGVASYQESVRRKYAPQILSEAVKKKNFIPLSRLSAINPQSLIDPQDANLYYAEALGVVYYLIKEFGEDNFVFFCQELRDKKNIDSALRYAYPFKNIEELGKSWEKYLSND